MNSDANDPSSRKRSEIVVLVLLRDGPRDKISSSHLASRQIVEYRLFRDVTFECDLRGRVREEVSLELAGRNRDEELT
jgi:hypothetical protein